MNKPNEYIVVTRINVDKLIEAVNTLIDEGWHPLGGHSHTLDYQELDVWSQTLVHYGD